MDSHITKAARRSAGGCDAADLLERRDGASGWCSSPTPPVCSTARSSTPSIPASRSAASAKRPDDVMVVGIDDRSFGELGERWPFPGRSTPRRSTRSEGRRGRGDRLRRPVHRADAPGARTTRIADGSSGRTACWPRRRSTSAAAQACSAGADPARDRGARRQQQLRQRRGRCDPARALRRSRGWPSFAIATVEVYRGERVPEASGFEWIDFVGGPRTVETVSFLAFGRQYRAGRNLRRQDRRGGRHRPLAPGRPRHGGRGRQRDGGPGDPGECDPTALADFPLQKASDALNVARSSCSA